MNKLMKKIAAVGLSAVFVAGTVAPSQAMPIVRTAPIAATSDATVVDHRPGHRRNWDRDRGRRDWNNHRGGYYNGHRGYRDRRPGYRRHNDGWWYPLAAFGAGAIIGGAIANQPRYAPSAPAAGINPRHVDWCSARYRSYRAYDNTFQPYNGPRQQCYSPYF